jgi:hypothetical protein
MRLAVDGLAIVATLDAFDASWSTRDGRNFGSG